MSTFQDQIEADRDAVFLNTDEFASTHAIDGAEVICVIASALSADGPAGLEAVWTDSTVLHVSTEAIERWPVGSRHVIDGTRYTVQRLDEQQGMYQIIVTRHRS